MTQCHILREYPIIDPFRERSWLLYLREQELSFTVTTISQQVLGPIPQSKCCQTISPIVVVATARIEHDTGRSGGGPAVSEERGLRQNHEVGAGAAAAQATAGVDGDVRRRDAGEGF